eukprot:764105-Hanusia_phi.AAC.2
MLDERRGDDSSGHRVRPLAFKLRTQGGGGVTMVEKQTFAGHECGGPGATDRASPTGSVPQPGFGTKLFRRARADTCLSATIVAGRT